MWNNVAWRSSNSKKSFERRHLWKTNFNTSYRIDRNVNSEIWFSISSNWNSCWEMFPFRNFIHLKWFDYSCIVALSNFIRWNTVFQNQARNNFWSLEIFLWIIKLRTISPTVFSIMPTVYRFHLRSLFQSNWITFESNNNNKNPSKNHQLPTDTWKIKSAQENSG